MRRGALSLQNEDPTPQDGWEQKLFKFSVRALMLKSYKNHRILMNSAKSNDFMPPRGATATLLSCAQGTFPLQKIPRGPHARTAARA